MNHPKDSGKKFECHARRHMTGAVYKTYDAILAMALSFYKPKGAPESDLRPVRQPGSTAVFFGRIMPTLANHTGSSPRQLYTHLDWLLKNGWLVEIDPPNDAKRERDERGRFAPVLYYVFEHDEWLKQGKGRKCPVFKYKVDGERIEKDEQPAWFVAIREMKEMSKPLADFLKGRTQEEIAAHIAHLKGVEDGK